MGDAQGQSGLTLPVFFLDENHCGNPHLHAAFRATGVPFEKYTDHFQRGAEDTEWIPAVAQHGWVVITADARIRRNSLERQAVMENKLRLFYFSRNDFSGVELGEILKNALPKMRAICEDQSPPFAASISRTAEVVVRDVFHGSG